MRPTVTKEFAAAATRPHAVLLSGGVDSTTIVASVVANGSPCEAVHVSYGQGAERDEALAAASVAEHYGLRLHQVRVSSAIPLPAGEILGRNAFLLHVALMTLGRTPSTMALGIHAGTPYRDCGEQFLRLAQNSYEFHTDGAVAVVAPFIDWTKADIYRTAARLKVPINLTYSCERGGVPCGLCLSCVDRTAIDAYGV